MEDSGDFLKGYSQAREHEKFLMCESYMYGFLLPVNVKIIHNLFIGEVQLRAFTSVILNRMQWK